MYDTQQTPEQWAAFISDAETKLAEKKEAMDSTLNSATASETEKINAVHDYHTQEQYLDWVKSKYNEFVDTGEIPADMHIDIDVSGSLYKYDRNDGEGLKVRTAVVPIQPELSSYSTKLRIAPLNTGTYTLFTSEDLVMTVTATAPAGSPIWIDVRYDIGNYAGVNWRFNCVNATNNGYITATGRWAQQTGLNPGTFNWYGGAWFKYGYAGGDTWANIPVWGQWTSAIWSVEPYEPSGTSNPDGLLAFFVAQIQIDGDVDTPWDFYNDDVLPGLSDPDNAIFPRGWDPIPDRPAPDPPDFPEDTENGGSDIILPRPEDVGAGSSGFITFYALSAGQLGTLAQLLYTSFDTEPNYFKNFLLFSFGTTGSINVSDIMSMFISMRQYPFSLINLSSHRAVGNNFYIGSGKYPLDFGSALHSINALDYVSIGDCEIPFWYGDFRDYSMQITLYLPYCGTVELNPADVLGGKLSGEYWIDFCTGACTAYVVVKTWDGKQFPIAQLPGQIGADVPVTATNSGQISARLGGDVLNVAGTLLGGAKSVINQGANAIMAGLTGDLGKTASSGAGALLTEYQTGIELGKQLAGIGERGAIAAPMLSGGRGFSSFNNAPTAYVQVRSPFYSLPGNYSSTAAYPATQTVTLSSCSGLCAFYNPLVNGVSANDEEKKALRQALQTGVII